MAIAASQVCLVIIGPNWISASDEQGRRRLFLSDDWVRREVEIALASSRTKLIPVLVQGATLPSEDQLPESIRGLLDYQAKAIDHESWDNDSRALIRRVYDLTGLSRMRFRMKTILLLLAAGLVYSIFTVAFELAVASVRIDTHLSSIVDLLAASFCVLGLSFLRSPLWKTLVHMRIVFSLMIPVQALAYLSSILIWGTQYSAVFFDGLLIIIFLVAILLFLRDAKKMVKTRA